VQVEHLKINLQAACMGGPIDDKTFAWVRDMPLGRPGPLRPRGK
jgi:hypothetical protein